MKLFKWCLIFIVFVSNCKAQQWLPFTRNDFNLKGKVRLVQSYVALANYQDTLIEKIVEYEYRNDISVKFMDASYLAFSEGGYLWVNIPKIASANFTDFQMGLLFKNSRAYEFNEKSIEKSKKKLTFDSLIFQFPNPVESVLNIRFDYGIYPLGEDPHNPYFFKHVYKRNLFGRIMSLDERTGVKEIINHKLGGKIKRFYHYDNEGRVSSQDVKLKEKWKHRIFEYVMLHWMDISINSEVRYTFAYDAHDRMQEIRLYEDNRVIWRETYSYPDTLTRRPDQLDRFIVASRTFAKHLTNNATEWYNPHGDIVKSVNYNNEGETVRTRFYEYNYDEQYNWVQCRMYLEGDPQKGEVPTLVVNREITYFPPETEGKKK